MDDPLRVHGRRAYEELIIRQLGLAQEFVRWVEASNDYELAVPQTLPIVTFRLKAAGLSPQHLAAAHASIVDEVTHDGRRWISETMVKGQSVLRMMVISYLTEERHLLGLESALTKAASNLILRAQTKA